MKKRTMKWVVAGVIFLFIWIFFIGFSAGQPGSFYDKGKNALWIAHEWVGDYKSDAELKEFALKLQKNKIGTLFVHSGPLKEDGSIDPTTYKYSINFVDKMKKFAPEIQLQAWIGQLREKIDLKDESVRKNIAQQAKFLTQLVGFDGIHFDIEPVWDGDSAFIDTLEKTRNSIPQDKVISVALAEFIPESVVILTKPFHEFKNYNTETNYKNVGAHADQIVAMVYDTGIKTSWIYRWLVKEQTIWISKLYEDKAVFVGIPAYDDGTDAFDPTVENVENGLKGVIGGLNNSRSNEKVFAGVAIYPDWEMSDEEWQIYQNLWLK